MTENIQRVSTTGGKVITGQEAAKILKMSTTNMRKYMNNGTLLRVAYRADLVRQKLNFFLADVVALGIKNGILTQEEGDHFLQQREEGKAA
jgi:hypothetical protein